MATPPKLTRRTACAALAAGAIAAAGRADGQQDAAAAGAGGGRFPAQTLQDWVSYADHVAVYTVVAEREIPPSPEELARGEGLVGREVTLRVDGVLWRAPRAPALPAALRMTAPGWVLSDGRRRRMEPDGAPRVAPGERYVAPLARVEDAPGAPEWSPLSAGAQLPLEGDTVGEPAGPATELERTVAGRSPGELRAALHRQAPDPRAGRYRHLRPAERIRAVLRERGDAGTPARSERTGGG